MNEGLGRSEKESDESPGKPLEAELGNGNVSAARLKMAARRQRVFELKCRGFSVAHICKKLAEEGYSCSENTIYNDLHSDAAGEFLDELIRQQLVDITVARQEHPVAAMKYRDLLIERLLPHNHVENSVKVDVNVNQKPERNLTHELLADYERIVKSTVVGDIQRNSPKQPVDSSKADSEADTVSE